MAVQGWRGGAGQRAGMAAPLSGQVPSPWEQGGAWMELQRSMQDHGHMSPHQSTSCPHVCCSLCVGTIAKLANDVTFAKHDVNVIQCMCS